MNYQTVEVALPLFACRDETPDDIIEGAKLFVERLSSRLNSLIDDAVGGDEQAIRAMFGDFITVAAMNQQQPWRLADPKSTDAEVFHLEDKIRYIVQQIEL